MTNAIEILELKQGVRFYGDLCRKDFEELIWKIQNVRSEEKLQFVIDFLKNKGCSIKTIIGTKFGLPGTAYMV